MYDKSNVHYEIDVALTTIYLNRLSSYQLGSDILLKIRLSTNANGVWERAYFHSFASAFTIKNAAAPCPPPTYCLTDLMLKGPRQAKIKSLISRFLKSHYNLTMTRSVRLGSSETILTMAKIKHACIVPSVLEHWR